jgi:hypothetical protein
MAGNIRTGHFLAVLLAGQRRGAFIVSGMRIRLLFSESLTHSQT